MWLTLSRWQELLPLSFHPATDNAALGRPGDLRVPVRTQSLTVTIKWKLQNPKTIEKIQAIPEQPYQSYNKYCNLSYFIHLKLHINFQCVSIGKNVFIHVSMWNRQRSIRSLVHAMIKTPCTFNLSCQDGERQVRGIKISPTLRAHLIDIKGILLN